MFTRLNHKTNDTNLFCKYLKMRLSGDLEQILLVRVDSAR